MAFAPTHYDFTQCTRLLNLPKNEVEIDAFEYGIDRSKIFITRNFICSWKRAKALARKDEVIPIQSVVSIDRIAHGGVLIRTKDGHEYKWTLLISSEVADSAYSIMKHIFNHEQKLRVAEEQEEADENRSFSALSSSSMSVSSASSPSSRPVKLKSLDFEVLRRVLAFNQIHIHYHPNNLVIKNDNIELYKENHDLEFVLPLEDIQSISIQERPYHFILSFPSTNRGSTHTYQFFSLEVFDIVKALIQRTATKTNRVFRLEFHKDASLWVRVAERENLADLTNNVDHSNNNNSNSNDSANAQSPVPAPSPPEDENKVEISENNNDDNDNTTALNE